jgi:penicillin-binding protein 2
MRRAIVESSNVYFYTLANEMGVDLIHDEMSPFGFGRKTGIDVEGEVSGLLPSTHWKRRAYKRADQQKWYAGETISLGIGQGYNSFTMLQLATAMATLVSGGQRYEPRLVRRIDDVLTRDQRQISAHAIPPIGLKPEQVEVIREAMHGVTVSGTATRVFAGAGYQSGGKTGTAQAVGLKQNEKYSANRVEERLRDHALYVAFAPVENPQIAVAVIVENAGWGAGAAAPIARRLFDYMLLGQVPSEEDIVATRAGTSAAPIGTPRHIQDLVLPGNPTLPATAAAPASAASVVSAADAPGREAAQR